MWCLLLVLAGLATACSSPTSTPMGVAGAVGSAGAAPSDAGAGGALQGKSCAAIIDATCDACSLGCDVEGCRGGVCVVQEVFKPAEPDNVVDFTIAGDSLLWTNSSGEVLRSGLAGEAPTSIVAGKQDRMLGLAADASNVYWLGRMQSHVFAAEADGSGAILLATLPGQPFDLAIADPQTLFVTLTDVGEIWSVARADGRQARVATPGAGALHVAADSDYLAWSNADTGEVATLTRVTGKVTVVSSTQMMPTSVLLRDGVLYWASTGDPSMGVVSKHLPEGETTALAAVKGVESLALGLKYCYFAAGSAAYRVPLGGGAIEAVVTGYERLGLLMTTEHWLYFPDFYRGTIGRAAL